MGKLPHWSLETIYPSVESEEFNTDLSSLVTLLAQLKEHLSSTKEISVWLEEGLRLYQSLFDTFITLYSYTNALLTVDTTDKSGMRALNRVEKELVELTTVHVLFLNALSEKEGDILPLLEENEKFSPYKFVLTELLQEQKYTMDEASEALAADLNRSGSDAFGRLQEALSSTINVEWDKKSGERKTVIQLRSLAFDPDRNVRKRAYEKEIGIWKEHEVAFASALNGVKGTTLTLDKRRGYDSPLHKSILQARINQSVLTSLIEVIEENLPLFRRYLRAKAHALNLPQLAFYDLFAPLGESASRYSFEEAKEFIVEQFTYFHPPMGEFAKKAFESGWIDSEPRAKKIGGAYCTSFPLRKETRILANYDYSFDALSTIAHELGHAYHDHVTSELPHLLRSYPMTLAETASIFSQFVVFQGAMQKSSESEQIALIESFLQDSTQVCVDILSRYYFESEVFEKRKEGELMADEFSSLMISAQKRSYGDALDESALHPYMWAVKGHYYSSNLSFYNYPYAFGQLFGLGVYQLSEENPHNFGQLYDELLHYSGQEAASKVAFSVGLDITTKEFWQKGITLIGDYVDKFSTLVDYSGN